MDIFKVLKILNYLLGTAVVVSGLYNYLTTDKRIPLYVALAIIIAGPLEDLLTCYIRKSPVLSPDDKEPYVKIVDNTSSLAFLLLLGLVIYNDSKQVYQTPGYID
ncbi:MAG: hypothetical protein MJA84_00600 [Firmicutes bacterium]|nr:hypothetical protein [Bacillota bacterium]